MLQAEWLPVIAEASFNEILILDCRTLELLHANEAACRNLQISLDRLSGLHLKNLIASESLEPLQDNIRRLSQVSPQSHLLEAKMRRKDGSSYMANIHVCRAQSGDTPICILVLQTIGSSQETLADPGIAQSLFRAIVSNTPGLVYQFVLGLDDKTSFTYLSEGCQALLGLSVDQLQAHPELFMDLILPDDRASYLASMTASAKELKSWNWEGRIWIDAWKDIKWINLRATPHLLPDKGVEWSGIMTNITQSKLEAFEIRRSRARLAELSAHIEHLKEQERMQLAREVHDDLGGNLTAIKMALALLANRLPENDPFLKEKAQYLESLVDRTIESAHRIASDLRPSILDLGIIAALEWQSKEFEKQVGIPCRFSSTTKEIELQADQATAIFRIFQEALTNIAKHAKATQVNVNFTLTEDNLNLEIIDNGKGIETAERLKSNSFGIRSMTERANSFGGKLNITQTKGGGSTVSINIPRKIT